MNIDDCRGSGYDTGMRTSNAARCCAPVLQKRLAKPAAESLAAAFKAIADPGRLRLLNFIALQPSGEACVCNLTVPLGLSQPTVSHHLKVLVEAGLLERTKRGTWAYFRIVPARLRALRDTLIVPEHLDAAVGGG
jgi:ArsR family transcriptional regulator